MDALHLAPFSPVQPNLFSPLSPFSSPTQQCSSFWEMIWKRGSGKYQLTRLQWQEGYSSLAVCPQCRTAFFSTALPMFSSHPAQCLQGHKATANILFSPISDGMLTVKFKCMLLQSYHISVCSVKLGLGLDQIHLLHRCTEARKGTLWRKREQPTGQHPQEHTASSLGSP